MKNYYEENASAYIESTFSCDMTAQYNYFEQYSQKGTLLDIGCGSGRDSLYFQQQGYEVTALDPIEEFCKHARQIGIKKVIKQTAQDMQFKNEFDNIWACASLLHINERELKSVITKCEEALTSGGIMYMSFKYGEFAGERDGKYYCDMTEERIKELLRGTDLQLIFMNVTEDVKKRNNTKWINIIAKKNVWRT